MQHQRATTYLPRGSAVDELLQSLRHLDLLFERVLQSRVLQLGALALVHLAQRNVFPQEQRRVRSGR